MTGLPVAPAHGEVEQQVRSIAAARRDEPGALMPVLHDVQHRFGYIDQAWVTPIANELNLSRAEVHGVITFYADFRTTAPGRTTVRVCRAEACQSVGAHALAEHARDRLGIEFGGTTTDGTTTLEQVFCFGNCALGPTVEVNGTLYGRVDADRFDSLVDGSTS